MSESLGLKSDLVKDSYPIADRIFIRHAVLMESKDPFVEGLRRIFDASPDLKPAAISIAAGLNDSTIRKLLSGANSSPRVETAQRIAEQIGLHLSDVIAIGEHKDPANALAILFALREVSPSIREEAVKYAQFRQSQQLAYQSGQLPLEDPKAPKPAAERKEKGNPRHDLSQDAADGAPRQPSSRRRTAS